MTHKRNNSANIFFSIISGVLVGITFAGCIAFAVPKSRHKISDYLAEHWSPAYAEQQKVISIQTDKITALTNELTAKQFQISELQTNLDKANADLIKVRLDLKKAQDDLASKTTNSQELQTRVNTLTARVAELETNIETLTAEKIVLQKQIDDLNAALAGSIQPKDKVISLTYSYDKASGAIVDGFASVLYSKADMHNTTIAKDNATNVNNAPPPPITSIFNITVFASDIMKANNISKTDLSVGEYQYNTYSYVVNALYPVSLSISITNNFNYSAFVGKYQLLIEEGPMYYQATINDDMSLTVGCLSSNNTQTTVYTFTSADCVKDNGMLIYDPSDTQLFHLSLNTDGSLKFENIDQGGTGETITKTMVKVETFSTFDTFDYTTYVGNYSCVGDLKLTLNIDNVFNVTTSQKLPDDTVATNTFAVTKQNGTLTGLVNNMPTTIRFNAENNLSLVYVNEGTSIETIFTRAAA